MTCERLSRISARFPPVLLDQERGNKKPHVKQRNALTKIEQCLAQRQAEILLVKCDAEFASKGLGQFRGNHFQTGGESMARTHGTAQKINGLREWTSRKIAGGASA